MNDSYASVADIRFKGAEAFGESKIGAVMQLKSMPSSEHRESIMGFRVCLLKDVYTYKK